MFLYNFAFKLYLLLVYLASPFNPKARKLIEGRKHFFREHQPDNKKYIWFHCASLGEFEQARPIIEKIKSEKPHVNILLSFFSSSGYEVRKNYDLADKVIYLPFDSSSNARKFFATFLISSVVFVKYDIWPCYVKIALEKKIPIYLTSATFRADHFYFKWYGRFLQDLLRKFNKIFVQDESSLEILQSHKFDNVLKSGDVRVDRVLQIKLNNEKLEKIEQFTNGDKCFVFGSVYPSEMELIKYVAENTSCKIIVAPHSIEAENIRKFARSLTNTLLYSEFEKYDQQRILIIDNIGTLNRIYKYGFGVYVGGGYDKVIHNILEPAVWGVPVYFGPNYHKFPEADSLIHAGIAFSEKNADDLAKMMSYSAEKIDLAGFEQRTHNWFQSNSGATDLICRELSGNI